MSVSNINGSFRTERTLGRGKKSIIIKGLKASNSCPPCGSPPPSPPARPTPLPISTQPTDTPNPTWSN